MKAHESVRPKAEAPGAGESNSETAALDTTAPAIEPGPSPLEDGVPAADGPRELFLLRHADAGDPAMWIGDDAERPLSSKGRRQAKRLARFLDDGGHRPDVIVTSRKVRAHQTAKAVQRRLDCPIVVDDVLGGPLGLADLAALLERHAPARRIMLVGHDPDFSAIASALSGAPIEMKKGALARIDLALGPTKGAGSLRWLIPPDMLPR